MDKKANNGMKAALSWSLYIIIPLLICSYVVQFVTVVGDSMNPRFEDSNHLIMEKISKRVNGLNRFDIIVFRKEGFLSGECVIKRIIGMPEETVEIKEGIIYINGEIIEENYGKENIIKHGNIKYPKTLGNDEYFVLGDNRNHSIDSRFNEMGFVKQNEIDGRVIEFRNLFK